MKIIGDVMLDVWVQGDCTKVSPEASALVLKEKLACQSLQYYHHEDIGREQALERPSSIPRVVS